MALQIFGGGGGGATAGSLANVFAPRSPSLFNVRTYGAVGDGTTDDTAAFNAAIAAWNTATKGTLAIPAGTYKITAALTAITATGTITGEGSGGVYDNMVASRVEFTSTTAVCFTIAQHGVKVSGFGLVNVAGTPPTAGAGIKVTSGDGAKYLDLYVKGFWVNIDIQDGAEWTMDRCFIYGPVLYGLKIQHIDLPDGGDMGIFNSEFVATTYAAVAAVRVESGGGLRFVGNKINYRTSKFVNGLDFAIAGDTSVLTVTGNSFENVTGNHIRGRVTSGGYGLASITGNEFAHYFSSSPAIDITGWRDVTIVGNSGWSTSSASPFILLTSVTRGAVGLNQAGGFSGEVSLVSCTGIRVGAATAKAITTQTGTTYTLVAGDAGGFVTMSNAAASTLTVPPNSSVAFPIGTFIEGTQLGAGQVTLTPGAGVSISASPGLKVAAQFGTFALLKTSTDGWLAYGRLSA